MARYSLLLFTLSLLLLNGCAVMNQEECVSADWRTIGFEDGAEGYQVSRIARYRSACAEHNVIPNLDAYRTGHQEGLVLYCTLENGYSLGLRGDNYHGVCTGEAGKRFLSGYQAGNQQYQLNQRISNLESEIADEWEVLDTLKQEIETTEKKLVNAKATPEQRRRLLERLRELPALIEDQEKLIAQLRQEVSTLNRQSRQLKNESPLSYSR